MRNKNRSQNQLQNEDLQLILQLFIWGQCNTKGKKILVTKSVAKDLFEVHKINLIQNQSQILEFMADFAIDCSMYKKCDSRLSQSQIPRFATDFVTDFSMYKKNELRLRFYNQFINVQEMLFNAKSVANSKICDRFL